MSSSMAVENKGSESSSRRKAPSGRSDSTHRHDLRFTGSGSEYFRIWIVNLLLTVVTLGLYYPWAKVRKLKYFYGNTHVAGHALDFHGEPKQMLRGFLLMSALFIVYGIAARVSETAGNIAVLIFAAVWPALMRASLQFRLGQTSWRGLRFRFTGSVKDAYLVFGVPLLGLVVLMVAATALITGLGGGLGLTLGLLTMLCGYALMPYMLYRLKAYQHSHYAYADLQTEFRASFADVAKVFLKTGGMSLLMVLVAGGVAGVLVSTGSFNPYGAGGVRAALALLPLILLVAVALQLVPVPYFQAQMQNVVWTNTGNRQVRFKSALSFPALLKQTALNWVLMVLTLGLYWPFAAVAMARLKVQAISVHLRTDPDQLVAARREAPDARGTADAAADLAGIDLGL